MILKTCLHTLRIRGLVCINQTSKQINRTIQMKQSSNSSNSSKTILIQSNDSNSKNVSIYINPNQKKEILPTKSQAKSNPNREKYQNNDQIPATVLQYERQMRKLQAASRASSPLPPKIPTLYSDPYMIVVNKPSGVLCVPGLNNHPSVAQWVYDTYGPCEGDKVDQMIVHRLDMDTSGVVIFALTQQALKTLQTSFRDRQVEKTYEALVCGHINHESGTIDLPLQRDHKYPPFMRISTPQSEYEASIVVHDLKHNGWKKIIKKKPKPSQTYFQILQKEYWNELPITRLALSPITGRTHQLRVHMAAIGHPIVGDPAYGIMGEASPNGGLDSEDVLSPLGFQMQNDILKEVQKRNQCMCLHAKILKIKHPMTGESMVFQADPSF